MRVVVLMMVRPVGFEPTRGSPHLPLRQACLPFHHERDDDYGEDSGNRTRIIRWTGGGNQPLYYVPVYGAAGRDRTRDVSVRSRALSPTEVLPHGGSRSWARTSDLTLNRRLLYQLSYAGMMTMRCLSSPLMASGMVLRDGIGPPAQRSSGARSTSELHGAYGGLGKPRTCDLPLIRRVLLPAELRVRCVSVRLDGGTGGDRTRNLGIKSPLLLPVELRTQRSHAVDGDDGGTGGT